MQNHERIFPVGRPVFYLFLGLVLYACSPKDGGQSAAPAFYYWKSVFKLSDFEKQRLNSLKVSTLYLKMFDVAWDPVAGKAIPIAKLMVSEKGVLKNYQVIPTVFITNDCMVKLDSVQVVTMANQMHRLIIATCNLHQINYPAEIQIDCDWTAATRDKYFYLLSSLKKLGTSAISATIRLHQVKFSGKAGIPPVDRGLLMCYNMGNLKNPDTKNSILEVKELKKYIAGLSRYPLTLDIALPLFDWKVLFRENSYQGLIQDMPEELFTSDFSRTNNGRVTITRDTLISGYELKKGDQLRIEKSNLPEIIAAAKEVNHHLKNTPGRVSLYHLDSVTLKKFTSHELESIYRVFH